MRHAVPPWSRPAADRSSRWARRSARSWRRSTRRTARRSSGSPTCASRWRSSTRPTACASTSLSLGPTDTGLVRAADRHGARSRGGPGRCGRRTCRWAGSAARRRCATRSSFLAVRRRRRSRAARCSRSTAGSRRGGCEWRSTGFRVLDADAHVVEPADVFATVGRRPARARSTCPPTRRWCRAATSTLVADQFEHGFDAPSYLRAMDAQGIDAVVLYPSIGLFVPFLPDAHRRRSRPPRAGRTTTGSPSTARHDPSRLAGVALVPLADVDARGRPRRSARRARARRRDGRGQPPLRPQPRRPALRPAVGRVRRARPHAVGARGARRARARRSARDRFAGVRGAARAVAPDGADGGDGVARARRRARAAPGAAGRVPRVGHRAGCRTGSPGSTITSSGSTPGRAVGDRVLRRGSA